MRNEWARQGGGNKKKRSTRERGKIFVISTPGLESYTKPFDLET
jgi:hypothetical protein